MISENTIPSKLTFLVSLLSNFLNLKENTNLEWTTQLWQTDSSVTCPHTHSKQQATLTDKAALAAMAASMAFSHLF